MDNDVILKLAAVRLLEEWKKIAVKTGEEVRVLATSKYFFRRKRDLASRYGAEGVRAAIAFAEQCPTISEANNPEDFVSLIREKVVAGERADTVLRVAFGLGLETTREKATEALEHYIAGLRRETGDLLITSEGLKRLLAK